MIHSFKFTNDFKEPSRVRTLQLELVSFTLTVISEDGNCFTVTNSTEIQTILNQAHDFNRKILHDSSVDDDDDGNTYIEMKGNNQLNEEIKIVVDDDGEKKDTAVIIEVQLDPVNSVNAYHIPA
mmetsp:Transcript_25290/g.31166  ORF Transcript_25290/g.31166 Transcript_25290/m.31166 type:complete len:124 (-) Transcript_25290:114-485(-)